MVETEVTKLQNQLALARREINNLRHQLTTLSREHKKEMNSIYQTLSNFQCEKCRKKSEQEIAAHLVTDITPHNTEYLLKPIGQISTYFPEKRATPRQAGICKDIIAKLTLDKLIFTNPAHALDGLKEYSHMWILFYFHKNESTHVRAKVAPPRLNGYKAGVFATRSPHRPCPIGLSLVKIDTIVDDTIYFCGVDMVDQTPVLDIKPYIPQYDNPMFPSLEHDFSILDLDERNSRPNNRDTSLLPNRSEFNTTQSAVLDSPSTREMDGEEDEQTVQNLNASETSETRRRSTSFHLSNARIGEREAPDGEEEEASAIIQNPTPSIPSTSAGIEQEVRVPSWIDRSAVTKLRVQFKDRALALLSQLGAEGEEKKRIILNVLHEDPRSVYLRRKWSGHCYLFRIAELYVSCKFNDDDHTVVVYQIYQNERQAEVDEL